MFKTKTAPIAKKSDVQTGLSVLKTRDLSIFKTIKGNRPLNLQHIRRLSYSMKENGVLINPIIVNEYGYVIDGQHRLEAAKENKFHIFYIIVKGYNLNDVHTLNLNQKNWGKKDYMLGYASMGIESYIKLKEFSELNDEFLLNSCISLCSNASGHGLNSWISKFAPSKNDSKKGYSELAEVFEEGTWEGKDFELAQEWADNISLIKPYYDGYNKGGFVAGMISLFKKEVFDFTTFMSKLRIQPTALVDCGNMSQRVALIENIYNYRNRNKVNLRY